MSAKKIRKLEKAESHAAETMSNVIGQNGVIHVFSHFDTDGLSAAGIIAKSLHRSGARSRVRIIQWIDEKIVRAIVSDKPALVIFTDLGSGYIDLLNKELPDFRIIILDHHQPIGEPTSNIIHVNPHLFGIDGARDISGSGVAYLAAKALDERNVELAPIAVVGALGDIQDKYDQRRLGGLNETIVQDAKDVGLMKVEKDLIFFGRETRPLHRVLAATTSPYIPGISGEEDKSLAFLSSLSIELKHDERWRALRDLTQEEKKKLCSALADHLLSQDLHYEISNLVGHIYTLHQEEPWTPLRDAREFSVLLNATGRMDKPSVGVAVCMGDRSSALEEANNILKQYRRTIGTHLNWIMREPQTMSELENIFVVDGSARIEDKIVGAVSSIISTSLSNPEKPLIMYTNVNDEAKFSARTLDLLTEKGVNLGKIMQIAAEKCLGKGGGHNVAAGAQIPLNNVRVFIKLVNELVGKQLKGEEIGS